MYLNNKHWLKNIFAFLEQGISPTPGTSTLPVILKGVNGKKAEKRLIKS